ncbi:MAG: hypothetical protein QOF89_1701 [Acidobacteriota bacterium]|nr:hypothetical protein [Acidobacteriota bacterium]
MIKLKVMPIGDSACVVLPREVLSRLKVQKGDVICLTETSDGYQITPCEGELGRQVEEVERVMRGSREILRELAK